MSCGDIIPGTAAPPIPGVGEPIIPGIVDIIPGMALGTGLPQACSQPVMVLISGACAASILAASALTFGFCVWLGAIWAISIACSWCGIICWANMTSASLKLRAGLDAVADG